MESLWFSTFRELMDQWDEVSKQMDLRDKINRLLDNQGFSLFFTKGDSIFGAPEESRVIFARMKNPDPDTPKDWADQASFLAINLDGIADQKGIQSLFGNKDIPDIKIVDQDKATDALLKKKK